MKLRAIPISVAQANLFVAAHHRHNDPVLMSRLAIGAIWDDALIGVAIVGNPVARELCKRGVGEVRRLCVSADAPRNTCSFLYGACWREWRTRVFKGVFGHTLYTYTLQSESGASLRGAGWKEDARLKGRKGWDTPSRPRINQSIAQEPKIRWVKTSTP